MIIEFLYHTLLKTSLYELMCMVKIYHPALLNQTKNLNFCRIIACLLILINWHVLLVTMSIRLNNILL